MQKHFQTLTKILRHWDCHWADGSVLWSHVLTLLENVEYTQRKIDGRTQSFYRQTQNGVLWGPIRKDDLHSCSTRTQPRCQNQSNFILFETDTVGLEGRHIPSTRRVCFFSAPNPQEPSSRQRAIDWKGLDDEPRMVLHKHSNRPDQDCTYDFNLRLSQNANLVFHPSGSEAIILYDKMPASALDKVVTFVGGVFCSKGTSPDR